MELALIEQLAHFLGPLAEKAFGTAAIVGGTALALGGWFCDYGLIEWRCRRWAYSFTMWAIGTCLVGFVFYLDWDSSVLFRCILWGVLMYLPLHQSTRSRRRETPR